MNGEGSNEDTTDEVWNVIQVHDVITHEVAPVSYTHLDVYKRQQLYQVIRDCNIVIDNLDDDGTKAANTILATAYGLRAVCYYQLLRYFCEAPEKGNMDNQLGLALVQTFNLEDRPLRSSMQATVDFIEADLKKSINYTYYLL